MVKYSIWARSRLFNNPEAKGFTIIGQKDGATVFMTGAGSSVDPPIETRAQAEARAVRLAPGGSVIPLRE